MPPRAPTVPSPHICLADSKDVIDLATLGLPAHPLLRRLATQKRRQDAFATAFDTPGAHPAGLPELRDAVADHLTRQGLHTTAGQIMITAGAGHTLALLAGRVAHPRDRVVVEDPTSPQVLGALRALQMTVSAVRPVTDGHDQLTRLLERRRVRLVHVMPTLGPRGLVLDHEFRNRLAWAIADRDAFVIDDISNAPLAFATPPPPLAAYTDASNVITMGSLAPLHWGELTVTWIRAAPMVITSLSATTTGAAASTFEQLLACELLAHEDQIRTERVTWLRDRLTHASTLLSTHLPQFTWRPPEGGVSLWIRPPGTGFDTDALVGHGVALVPRSAVSPQSLPGRFALAYARPPDVLDEGVRRLAAAWRQINEQRL
ncbi:aminotransferase class I/II-fold pyridoxal phosphate-dependent enzyme [Actinosynnema sp. ALI-1.44]|uniref:aminotransferase class I/II-fold pyridoxal phosphate-dependent enzyme n=1 Tax=Actinosynnema sp. ALI-1.44 TaxID=1933779 RepID=UPI00143DE6B4|nr:aminotransferase class I/II-fold pyridoxal phosphate-dependent enzyme [Actinosynnema sp. ALI-1.44]